MEEQENKEAKYYPKFYELLSEEDKLQYDKMHHGFSFSCRNLRGKRVETFSEILSTIRQFCVRGDLNDPIRCLVCGICWIPNGIAINTRQLCILLKKCKSSINGSLQKLGYSTLQNRPEASKALTEAIPMLKDNFSELREWSVRLFVAATPQPSFPQFNYPSHIPFTSPIPKSQTNTNLSFPQQYSYNNPQFSSYSSFPYPPQPKSPIPSQTFSQSNPTSFEPPPNSSVPNTDNSLDQPFEGNSTFTVQPPLESNSFDSDPSFGDADYFDDPFCCVPSFLVDSQNQEDPFNV